MHEQQQARLSRASSMRPLEDQRLAGRVLSPVLSEGPPSRWLRTSSLPPRPKPARARPSPGSARGMTHPQAVSVRAREAGRPRVPSLSLVAACSLSAFPGSSLTPSPCACLCEHAWMRAMGAADAAVHVKGRPSETRKGKL